MSKKRRKRNQSKRRGKVTPSRKPAPPSRGLGQLIRSAWKALVGIGVIAGLFTAYLTLLPNVEVYSQDRMRQPVTIRSPFVVRNAGFFPISDLRFEYLFKTVESEHSDWHNLVRDTVTTTDLPVTYLRRGERTTATCFYPITVLKPITMADLQISLVYRYLWWKKRESFRFITLEDGEGYLYWTPKSIADE